MEPVLQIVTFLMTDVVESSPLWEQDPTAMGLAAARHDELASGIVGAHGGRLVKPRGEGDSLFIVFSDPRDAVRCAAELRDAMEKEPWPTRSALRIRAAVNTGPIEARAGDYYGSAVNLCARLRSAANPSQILIGPITADLLAGRMPDGLRFSDLGDHSFSGIGSQVRVFQLDREADARSFPPIRSLHYAPTNLPYIHNSDFVGREREMEAIHAALMDHPPRDVAIVGLTGIGKTQLAVEYAHRYREAYPGGIFFVNASDTAHLHMDCASIASLLGVSEHLTPDERAQRVRATLSASRQPVLVIVDQLSAKTDIAVIPRGPECRVIVTCVRHHLVRRHYALIEPPPLALEDALTLLQRHRPLLQESEREAATRTVQMLGCLPVALALVANHIERLGITFAEYEEKLAQGPIDLLARARRRFISDTGHDGELFDALAMHYASLEPDAQTLLTLASILADRGITPDTLARCGSLTDRDLVDEAIADLVDDCFMMRETDGRLSVHSLVQRSVRSLVNDNMLMSVVVNASTWFQTLLARANEATDWSRSRSEVIHCFAVADHCRRYGLNGPLEALLGELGSHQFWNGLYGQAFQCFDEAAGLAEAQRGSADLRYALHIRRRSEARQRLGEQDAALRDAREALDIALTALDGSDALLADFYTTVGYVLRMSGDLAGGEQHYRHALGILDRTLGRNHRSTATCLNNLGAVREAAGNLADALELFEQALQIDCEISCADGPRVAIRLNNIGRVHGKMGDWDTAEEHHARALDINLRAYGPDHPDVAGTYYHLGLAAQGRKDTDTALAHFGQALAIGLRFHSEDHPFCDLVRRAMGSTTTAG